MKLDKFKQIGFALSILIFPIMLLAGFLMHPNLLQMRALTTAQQLVDRFHHNPLYHIGHLIVMFSVPIIIIVLSGTMTRLTNRGRLYGYWGAVIGVFGAFILAVDKGAMCLVMSAFETIPDNQFNNLIPYLQVIVDKAGLLFVLWLLPLLPIGAIIQAVGLIKENLITKWQGIFIIIGLSLLNNPDIELISSIGASFMVVGYIPWGVKEIRYYQAEK